MSAPTVGGPAFPGPDKTRSNDVPDPFWATGMTLRDWFAGQFAVAMALDCREKNLRLPPESLAKEMYRFADAMLAERAKEKP